MKLELVNFKCYRGHHSFDFFDNGMTLISGKSGAGKSSLVMAISFAITGQPSKPTPVTMGADSCKVILEWLNMTIIRTKRPDCLKVIYKDNTYHDDIAQSYINQIYSSNFSKIGYISQNYMETFIFLSPLKKLDFLESLCFSQESNDIENPNYVKEKLKNHIDFLKKDQLTLISQLKLLNEQINEEKIDNPLKEIEQPDIYKKKVLMEDLEKYRVEEKTYIKKKQIWSSIEELNKKIVNIEKTINSLYNPEYEKYNDISLEIMTSNISINNELKNMKFFDNLWEKWSKEETENYIIDYENDISNLKKWIELNFSIEKLVPIEAEIFQLEEKRKTILEQNEGLFICPKCKSDLVLSNDELVICTNTNNITNSISKEKKKLLIDDIDKTIKNLRNKISSLEYFKKEKFELESKIDPEEDIDALKNDLKTLREHLKDNSDKEYKNNFLEKRREILLQQKTINMDNKEIENIILYRKKKNALEHEINVLNEYLEDKIKILGTNFDVNNGLVLDLKIQNLEKELEIYRTKEYDYNIYISKKDKWERYKTKMEYQTAKKEQLEEITKKLEVSLELKNLVLKTESEIIEFKLKEINELVNSFTENLFIEPMYIDLTTTKPTKDGEKVQINLQITYKNMNDVNLLSGGEKARLNLIFMLAFNIVFKSPLILLDECTSNLDQEMTEQVLEHIENLNLPKVIFIAHQIVEGNFQQIIRV